MDDEENRLLLSSAEAAYGSDTFLFCMPCRLPIRTNVLCAQCFMRRMSLVSLVEVTRNEFDRYILSRSWRPFAWTSDVLSVAVDCLRLDHCQNHRPINCRYALCAKCRVAGVLHPTLRSWFRIRKPKPHNILPNHLWLRVDDLAYLHRPILQKVWVPLYRLSVIIG